MLPVCSVGGDLVITPRDAVKKHAQTPSKKNVKNWSRKNGPTRHATVTSEASDCIALSFSAA